ncbi:Frataxin [Artomyces pyxidatus]|uniref:Frataxin n=1 Tax=Artomyces pyxidatus TaxID=48021 RepID=A0ACB8THD3_9AGAM|nr:Frataxin [Artomyces pyxidatus]
MFTKNLPRLLAQRAICQARLIHNGHLLQPYSPMSNAVHRRHMSTPAPQVNTNSELSMHEYHQLSDSYMDAMLESLEAFVDSSDEMSYEVEYHSGVLTLTLGEGCIYVINKQPPNKQIWLSSPFSGPKRYDYSSQHDDWVYSRDGSTLGGLLNDEIAKITQEPVDLGLGPDGRYRSSSS